MCIMCMYVFIFVRVHQSFVSSFHVYVQWLEETFLPYLDGWEQTVEAREGFTKEQNAPKSRNTSGFMHDKYNCTRV